VIKLYHASLSRSVRIVWLLEELGIPYELVTAPLEPPAPRPFVQPTPTGKVPSLEEDGVVLFESGAILQYVLERHGDGRLMPPPESPLRGPFLQWVHFAESTAFSGIGNIAWHTRIRADADEIPAVIEDYRSWAAASLDVLEHELDGREYILGSELSGADVMLGYTVLVAQAFGILGEARPNLAAYLARLTARPAMRKALAS
jgi:glutathione S-transferase